MRFDPNDQKKQFTQEQKAFHNMVLSLGGISIIDKFQSDDLEGNSYVESISRF